MEKRKKIAVCVANIHQKTVHSMMTELGNEAVRLGYDVQFFTLFSNLFRQSEDEKAQQQIFDLIPFDEIYGLIIFSETIQNRNVMEQLIKKAGENGVPVFSLKQEWRDCYNIRYDSEYSLEEILCHLIEVHHCKKINFLSGSKGHEVSERRNKIYRKVLSKYGYPLEEERIGYGDFWEEPAKKEVEKFLSSALPRPDAIVCANDAMAIAACDYLQEKGLRIPADIIVTGLGGIEARDYQHPLLTTALYDVHLICKKLMELVTQLPEKNERKEFCVKVPCKVDYTESCGCIEHDRLKAENNLRSTYDQLIRERQYSHAAHDYINEINAAGTLSVLVEKLPEYIWGPQIKEYHLYLDDSLALDVKYRPMAITERKFILCSPRMEEQEKGTHGYSEYRETGQLLYKRSHQVMTMPLNVEGNFYGIFNISYQGNDINHECLYELVMTINGALHAIHSRMDLLRVSRQLNKISEQTIQSLAEIVEAKSEFTGMHVKRVSEYTRILAEAMGYSPEQVDIIRIASMMHDIGKINISSSILEKPDKLTDEEFEIIKEHVVDGRKMLQSAPGDIMEMACRIAYEHHEKWNGTGYIGMSGEEISMESRIVALADVFDALVSKRPYKKPFSAQNAYDIILADSGTHFDPQVVEVFSAHFDSFVQVMLHYQDEENAEE